MALARWFLATSLVITTHAGAAPSSDLKGPTAEVGDPAAKVALPAVPVFEVPVAPAGTVGVRELLVAGKPLLDTDLKVSGYVTWIYDCVSAVRRPGQSAAKAQKMIDEDPTLCERAKFYLGDAKTTPLEKSLWVVDVPRAYNKLEVARIKKADRTPAMFPDRCEPDKKRKNNLCVPLAVGDYVTLSGKFALSSPHSERNSDGLIVFGGIAPATPPARMTMKALAAPPSRPLTAIAPKAALKPPASEAARKDSIKHSNEGTRAYGTKQFAMALTEYGEATKAWDGNHIAWYGTAGVHISRMDWKAAAASMAKAFQVAPTEPMYAMVLGYCMYESAVASAREDVARKLGIPVAQAAPDLASVDFSRSEQMLRYAAKLEPKLWRAHYYLGRIARDGGRAKDAADEFTRALAAGPSQPGPWIALTELYRNWQYSDLARTVAEQGTQRVTGPESTDVWYVLGMALDDLRKDDDAIAALTKALEADPSNAKATFQRGQVYFRKRKLKEAKLDLEAFVGSAAPNEFAKQQANKMLMDLAAKKGR